MILFFKYGFRKNSCILINFLPKILLLRFVFWIFLVEFLLKLHLLLTFYLLFEYFLYHYLYVGLLKGSEEILLFANRIYLGCFYCCLSFYFGIFARLWRVGLGFCMKYLLLLVVGYFLNFSCIFFFCVFCFIFFKFKYVLYI